MKIRFFKKSDVLPEEHLEHKDVKGFVNLWTKFQNWERHPPIVAVDKGKIVGFHAATFNRKIYVNSYYQFVSSKARGTGLGGKMFERVLQEAIDRGLIRFKCAARVDGDGDKFYRGFGMHPIAVDKDHYYYDIDISGVSSVGLVWLGKKYHKRYQPVSERELARHKKIGRTLL